MLSRWDVLAGGGKECCLEGEEGRCCDLVQGGGGRLPPC